MRLRIKNDRQNGFLLGAVDLFGHFWSHYCAVWSWAGVFHRIARTGSKGTNTSQIRLIQENQRHDACYVARLGLATVYFGYLAFRASDKQPQNPALDMLILSWCVWRAADNLINYVHGPLFGFKNIPGRREGMTLHRAQRRMMLTLIDYVEVVLVYASIYWLTSCYFGSKAYQLQLENPGSALQLSFSTITTVGYGTFAPVGYAANMFAFSQVIAGLLMIGGTIAQMASMLKEYPASSLAAVKSDGEEEFEPEGMLVTERELRLRRILPPSITAGMILTLYLFLYLSQGA